MWWLIYVDVVAHWVDVVAHFVDVVAHYVIIIIIIKRLFVFKLKAYC